jgi:hypothetical protein
MIKTSLNQKGSAHVVIIIILVIALLGVLGFVFWQNLIDKNPNTTNKTNSTTTTEKQDLVPKNENKTFANTELSFEYPNSGWKISDPRSTDEIVGIVSDDYKPYIGLGLESGAALIISRTTQQEVPNFPGVKDVKEVEIDGNKAYKYVMEYEGYRLQSFFTATTASGEKNYAITMETASHVTEDEVKTFDLALKTLDIK